MKSIPNAVAGQSESFDILTSPVRGRYLIEAGAGTGKTYSLEHLVLRLLVEEGVRIERILMVTFTKAATAEIRERVRALLNRVNRRLSGETGPGDPLLEQLLERWRQENKNASAAVQQALEHFDDACVQTIHSFCQKILSDFVFTRAGAYDTQCAADTGFAGQVVEEFIRWHAPQLSDLELRELIEWTGLSEILQKLCEAGPTFAEVGLLPAVREELKKRAEAAAVEGKTFDAVRMEELFAAFVSEAPARLKALEHSAGVMSFASLLVEMHRLVQQNPELVARVRMLFDAVLIDEFQDTDALQYKIFSTLFLPEHGEVPAGPASVFFVGDPKQAIYAFRMAELATYLVARRELAEKYGGRVLDLSKNFRSAPPLVACVNAWFAAGSGEAHFLLEDLQMPKAEFGSSASQLVRIRDGVVEPVPAVSVWVNPEMSAAEIKKSPTTADDVRLKEAQWVARDIASLLTDGDVWINKKGADGARARKLAAGDIAVLVRKRKAAEIIMHELGKRGVRSAVDAGGDVFQTVEGLEVLSILRSLVSPADRRLFTTARATRLWGRTLTDIRDRAETCGLEDRSLLQMCAEEWQRSGPSGAFLLLQEKTGTARRLLPVNGGSDTLKNYAHIIELLQSEFVRLKTASATLRWYEAQIRAGDSQDEARRLRPTASRDVVHIQTIHTSKGLEYPVVYLPAGREMSVGGRSESAFFRDYDAAGRRVAYAVPRKCMSAKHPATKKADQEELMRLAYVAMTRASSRLVVSMFFPTNRAWKSGFDTGYFQALTGMRIPSECLSPATPETAQRFLRGRLAQVREAMAADNAMGCVDCAQFADGLILSDAFQTPESILEIRDESPRECSVQETVDEVYLDAGEQRAMRSAWRRSSFTAIAHDMPQVVQSAASLDWEAESEAEEEVLSIVAKPMTAGAVQRDASSAEIESRGEVLLPFLRGADAGDWLHRLLEELFNATDNACREELLKRIPERLSRTVFMRGTSDNDFALAVDYVHNMIESVLSRPVFAGIESAKDLADFKFSDIVPDERVNEMSFLLSVQNDSVKGEDVLQVLAENGIDLPVVSESVYGELKGYMTGSIDMVFVAGGRFWVVDWKSNCIGSGVAAEYTAEAMREQIVEKHYALQYTIYLLALKRHLMHTFGWNDVEVWEHIGGALYVFLRGINAKDRSSATGVFFDRPQKAVDALDRLLAGL